MDPDQLNVAILGQGALGTLFGAMLAEQGHTATVVSSRASQDQQVTMEVGGRRPARGQLTLGPEPPETPLDHLIVASRAAQAVQRATDGAMYLASDGVVVPVQNGLVSLDVAEAVGAERTVPMIVGFNAQMRGDLKVAKTSPGGVTLGPLDEAARGHAEALTAALQRALTAHLTDNPRGAVWSKWTISSAINGLAVVSGHGVGDLAEAPLGRRALINLVTECVQLAEAEGIELERVAGPLKPSTLAGSTSGLGGWVRGLIVRAIGNRYQGVRPSSLDALLEGRDPEIAEINGRAVELGQAHAVEVPWNQGVVELTEEIQAGKREPGWESLEALEARANR